MAYGSKYFVKAYFLSGMSLWYRQNRWSFKEIRSGAKMEGYQTLQFLQHFAVAAAGVFQEPRSLTFGEFNRLIEYFLKLLHIAIY